jgi:hypothetical protein
LLKQGHGENWKRLLRVEDWRRRRQVKLGALKGRYMKSLQSDFIFPER